MAGTYKVYFATNRMPITAGPGKPITDFSSDLGPIDGTAIRFGSASVKVVGSKPTYVDGSLHVEDEQLIGPSVVKGSASIFEKLRVDMKEGGKPTLVLIHGFSNSFQDAIERAGVIRDFYGVDLNLFVFSWPSRGTNGPVPLPYADYIHDRENARASGIAMARCMRILFDYIDKLDPEKVCRQPIHLIAHSMGVFALRHAVQALLLAPASPPREYALPAGAQNTADGMELPALTALPTEGADPNRLRRTFEEVILAAGDEDEDAFDDSRELKFLPRLAKRVTVYHTDHDWILSTLSRFTKFNGPRLGMNGPDNMGSISDKVTAIDVSDVIDWKQDVQSHQYYRIFPAVRDDIVQVLQGVRQELVHNRAPTATQRYRIVTSRSAAKTRSKRQSS